MKFGINIIILNVDVVFGKNWKKFVEVSNVVRFVDVFSSQLRRLANYLLDGLESRPFASFAIFFLEMYFFRGKYIARL